MKVYCSCIHYHCWDICSGQKLWIHPWLIAHVIYQQISWTPPSNSLQNPQPFSPPSPAFVLVTAALPTQPAFASSSCSVIASQHLEWPPKIISQIVPLFSKNPPITHFTQHECHVFQVAPAWGSCLIQSFCSLFLFSCALALASPSTC